MIFLVAEDRSPIDADIRAFATTTGLSLLVLAAMLIGGVMLQVRVGLQPLFQLRREVAAVRTGKTDQRDRRLSGGARARWPASSTPWWPITRRSWSASAPMSAISLTR